MRQAALRIWAAILFPILILIGFQLYLYTDSARKEAARFSHDRATAIAGLSDAAAVAELKLVTALASSAALKAGNLPAAYRRAADLAAVSSAWRTVVLSDPIQGVEIFDLRRPLALGERRPIAAPMSREGLALQRPAIRGIEADGAGEYVIMVHAPVTQADGRRLLLTAEVDPAEFQDLVMARHQEGIVAALVDGDGDFIARSVGYASRLGRPATHYVRNAIKTGDQGLYRGVTYEGLTNYTAFVRAPVTGWSAHVAIPSGWIDGPRRMSFAIWGAVALACLSLSVFMVLTILGDLRRRRADEDRQRQSQKMEAVGQLTGGIAHDFNNLLTAIIGGLDMALRRADPVDPNRRYLEGALDAALRGAKLTSRLLAFSRTQRIALEPVDVEAVLIGMSELLEQSLGPDISVDVRVEPDGRWVTTDKNQLELALLNLAVNARDAMPGGGRLTFTAQALRRTRGGPLGQVEITVTDTGSGLPADVLARAFDPFFTTKDVNRGTGLGLAQVYAMARQSNGEATIENAPGQGARIRLRLPAAEAPADAAAPVEGHETELAPSGQKIVVLDDDDSVRGIVGEVLAASGYAVTLCSTGPEALSAIRKAPPDLLLVDFLMPGMNGADVVREVRARHPSQRVLFMSGHMDNDAVEGAVAGASVLRKPFVSAELTSAVRAALAEPPSG